jgi:hypothetical protein
MNKSYQSPFWKDIIIDPKKEWPSHVDTSDCVFVIMQSHLSRSWRWPRGRNNTGNWRWNLSKRSKVRSILCHCLIVQNTIIICYCTHAAISKCMLNCVSWMFNHVHSRPIFAGNGHTIDGIGVGTGVGKPVGTEVGTWLKICQVSKKYMLSAESFGPELLD